MRNDVVHLALRVGDLVCEPYAARGERREVGDRGKRILAEGMVLDLESRGEPGKGDGVRDDFLPRRAAGDFRENRRRNAVEPGVELKVGRDVLDEIARRNDTVDARPFPRKPETGLSVLLEKVKPDGMISRGKMYAVCDEVHRVQRRVVDQGFAVDAKNGTVIRFQNESVVAVYGNIEKRRVAHREIVGEIVAKPLPGLVGRRIVYRVNDRDPGRHERVKVRHGRQRDAAKRIILRHNTGQHCLCRRR